MLAQGFGVGIGTGLIFLPAMSVVSQYFMKRRSLAMGIVTTGGSVGGEYLLCRATYAEGEGRRLTDAVGICLPIMLNNLIVQHGFRKAGQYCGVLLLGTLVLAYVLMHPRALPARSLSESTKPPSRLLMLKSKIYLLLLAGLFFTAWGDFFPFFVSHLTRDNFLILILTYHS